jgi:hypothetical protein
VDHTPSVVCPLTQTVQGKAHPATQKETTANGGRLPTYPLHQAIVSTLLPIVTNCLKLAQFHPQIFSQNSCFTLSEYIQQAKSLNQGAVDTFAEEANL